MRYIIQPEKDGIQFGDYLDALNSYRHLLPVEVAEFASDEDRYVLTHPSSLHDAWVEQISVTESRNVDGASSRIGVALRLLGQMHDRHIILTYENVSNYSISGGENQWSTHQTLHGDVFTHEVRVSDCGRVVHEIAVGEAGKIEITCATFNVEEREP